MTPLEPTPIHTWRNYNHLRPRESRGEKKHGLSLTVPDMTLTRQQIIGRHRRKLPVPGFEPLYLGEDVDLPPYDADRMDVIEYSKAVNARIQELRNDLTSQLARTRQEDTPDVPPAPGAIPADPEPAK